jgi:RNA polymerase sigma factor (sigma-70 family)
MSIMAKTALRGVLQRVRMMAAVQTGRALSDADLLARFIEQNDEAAFTVLVERHGPMVLGVCQRSLRHRQDAEDACQATFLVLARKARSIRKKAALGSWLHGIACRVCANLRRQQARRQKRERRATVSSRPAGNGDNWHDVQAVLDEELQMLPDRYRAPLLLCYWEGKTRDEAAEHLGHTPGKLHGLLERGRTLLRQRLTGRGLTLSAALCATFLTSSTGKAALAPAHVVACARAAVALAAGEPIAVGMISIPVLTLTREVLRTMFVTKLQIATALVLCAGLLAALVGGSLPTKGLAQDSRPTVKVLLAGGGGSAPKGESDEAFIRRMSSELRGVEPSPTEIHFFLKNGDADKRQKLIDLFIQERQAKQAKHTQAKQANDVNAALLFLAADRLAHDDFRVVQRYTAVLVDAQRPGVVQLQSKFFHAVVAAKDKAAVSKAAHDYLDALTNYYKENAKAKDAPDAMLQIEMVYLSLGKKVEADAWAEKLKKEYPNSPAAQQRFSRLEIRTDRMQAAEGFFGLHSLPVETPSVLILGTETKDAKGLQLPQQAEPK